MRVLEFSKQEIDMKSCARITGPQASSTHCKVVVSGLHDAYICHVSHVSEDSGHHHNVRQRDPGGSRCPTEEFIPVHTHLCFKSASSDRSPCLNL